VTLTAGVASPIVPESTMHRRFHPSLQTAAIALLAAALLGCLTSESGNLEAGEFGDLSLGEPPRGAFDAELTAACGDGALTLLGTAVLRRQPYLQSVSANVARVLWTAVAPASLEVRAVTRAGAPVRPHPARVPHRSIGPTIDATAPLPVGDQFEARLASLQPDTIYCYRLVDDHGPWTSWTGFRTAPAPGQVARFSVMGDLGTDTADQNALLGQLVGVPSQAVLITGDVGYPNGTLSNFEDYFFDVYRPMLAQIPFFPIAGNHEYHTADGEPFRQVFSLPDNGTSVGRERWYSVDWGDVHIAALDTEVVGDEQAGWLDADLAATDARWKLVMLHKPPFSSGAHGDDSAVKEALVPIFARRGVHLVLAGHEHNYERMHPIDGVTYVITGGGGRGTRSVGTGEHTAFSLDVIHFVAIEADATSLRGWAIDATGVVFDTFEIAP
jgi:hypothetical protein